MANHAIQYAMDWRDILPVLLTAGIFLIGFLSLLLVSFNAMLKPISKDIGRLEGDIGRLEGDIKANRQELKADIKANKQELKALNAKLDQIIMVVAKIEQKTR